MEEVATSTPAPEAMPPATSASTVETTAERSDDFSDSVDFDINQVPENIRSEVEKYGRKWEKDFKSAYTRKTQELSARDKARESQVQQAIHRAKELEGILSDPQKVEAYRQLTQQQKPDEAPEFKTVGELLSYTEQKATNRATEVARRELETKLAELQGSQRWSNAFEATKAKAPTPEMADLAASLAMSDIKYRQYYTGNNESEVLQMALNDALNYVKPFMEKTKAEALKTVEKKQASTTFAPSKTVTTGGAKKLSVDEIIARVNSRVPR